MVEAKASHRWVERARVRSIGASLVLLVAASSAALALPRPAAAEPVLAPVANDPTSVFIVAKNHNRNQVHYAVRLDDACRVVGAQPVYGYWRMFEKHGEVEPILDREVSAYGVDPDQRIERNGEATTIRTHLNAVPQRPLVITVKRTAGRCEARASTSIAGSDALLRWVYVRFVWPASVDYILLHGIRPGDGAVVDERI